MKACNVVLPAKKLLAIAVALSGVCGEIALAQGDIDEIRITGSRIRQTTGMVTPVPVTAVTLTELSDVNPGGTIADQLGALPQFFGNRGAQGSTGAMTVNSGSSQLNLRNLGANRTLVLFDGSRVVPADITGVVGIDTFPTALLSTVDVVTGGASAAYGADALGGVVNFVLNREFEGLKVDVGTGLTEVGDGKRWNFSIAGGKQVTDRLHVIGSLEARHIDQIARDPSDLDGDWWKRWGHVTNPNWTPGAPAGTPQRLTLPWVSSTEHSPTGMLWARQGTSSTAPLTPFAFNGMTFTNDGQDVRPFTPGDVYAAPNAPGSTKSQSGGPEGAVASRAFDNGPYGAETIGRSAFTALKYDITANVSAFAQAMIGRSESNSPGLRSRYMLRDSWYATVYRDNAFLPPQVASAMDEAGIDSFQLHKAGSFIGDNNIGFGDGKERFTTVSWSAGIDAVLPNGWDLRASWQSGTSDNQAGIYGQTRVDRMFLGMDAVRDPATGAVVCRAQLVNPTEAQLAMAPSIQGRESVAGGPLLSPVGLDNSISECVPYNIMGAGNMSQAAVDYTQSPRVEMSEVEQDFAEVVVSGELFDGWIAPITFAAGLNYRDQSFEQWIESSVYPLGPPANAPELGIQGISPGYTGGSESLHLISSLRDSSGKLDVWEWFGELNVPVWESASGEQAVDGTLAYRSSDYSRTGRIESWKAGLNVQVIDDLRLRLTQSRDVREPTFMELFNNRGGAGATVEDPLTGSNYTVTTVGGGNPNLKPETGNTSVAGFVYQPSWFDGFQFSADWYKVEIDDAVSSLGAQRIVDGCNVLGDTGLCSYITRNADGVITRINNGYLNVAQAKVEGVDVEIIYRAEPNFFADHQESLTFRGLIGHLIERSDTPLDGRPQDTAGVLGTPDLNAFLTVGYTLGDYGVQLQQLYVADTRLNVNWVEGRDVDDNSVSSGNYTNLRLHYTTETDNGGDWTVSLNVTNLFDRSPPVVANYASSGNAQLIPNGYDTYGRRYQLGLNMSF